MSTVKKAIADNKAKGKKSSFTIDFIISGFSSAIGKTAIAPIERIKLLLQNQHIIAAVDQKYVGIIDCGKSVVHKEGILSLWRGNVSNVLRYIPNQAFNFAFKDTFKKLFRDYDKKKEFTKFLLANSISGGLAGAVSLGIIYPLDFIRTRLATDNLDKNGHRDFKGSIDLAKKIFHKEGVVGLYRGYVIAVVGIIPYRAYYFGVYDTLKATKITKDTSLFTKFAYAQITTNTGSMLVYPLDTIRRRIMLQSGKELCNQDYKNSLDCAKKIQIEEGFFGFYKGFGANILRGVGPALVLVLYDYIKEGVGLEHRN